MFNCENPCIEFRLLKIDLNTLFGFYEDITKQELILFCKEIKEAVLSDGVDAGFTIACEKICEYPNSDTLIHNFALLLQGLLTTAELEEGQIKTYRKQIDGWYERLTKSEEAVIRNSAYFMLAGRAIGDGQYEKAQEYLDRMPNRNDAPDKRMLQANIYLNQNRAEEAAKLLEQMLLTAVNDVQMILYKLIDTNYALGEKETADYVAGRVTKLAELFDLNRYNSVVASFIVAVANKDIRQTVEVLRNMFESMTSVWNAKASPLYRRVTADDTGVSMESMLVPLLRELRQEPEYEYLRNDEEFQKLLAEWEEKLFAKE